MSGKCLICGKPCDRNRETHTDCSVTLYGTETPPILPYAIHDLNKLATQIINSSTTVPGVQKKLSLAIRHEAQQSKLTFVGLWGSYILKPPVEAYINLPENELLTMNLADLLKIKTVPHGLIRLQSGELAYITRRIDRRETEKIPMEDMCQILEKMTEDKYRGSIEQIGKSILKNCENRIYDALRFFELILFCFITGNGDMHLKNFSLITEREGIKLAPAYDLLNTRLVISEKDDPDESALSINGKRRKLNLPDFFELGKRLGLTDRQMENVLKRFRKTISECEVLVESSFLPDSFKSEYKNILFSRWNRLN